MKQILFFLFIFICLVSQAQRTYFYGIVRDSLNKDKMVGVHIQNINAKNLTSTNKEGQFKMPGQIGDTILFSNVGYKLLAWIVDSS